jgi:hypothetical protein
MMGFFLTRCGAADGAPNDRRGALHLLSEHHILIEK